MTLLTIIIPSYNRSALLDKTLGTLTHQSTQDFRVIVVDHGSTDDAKAIVERYQQALSIAYYWIPRGDHFAPGIPRDFGVKQADTPFIAFLDTGMIVSSSYVAAHIEFQQSHKHQLGMGCVYAASSLNDLYRFIIDLRISSLLSKLDSVDEVGAILAKDQQLHDPRIKVNLEEMSFPWVLGWTTNLSMPIEAYQSAGGFNLELKGWGFEDLDLSYRLYKQGFTFAFVENGWGIELPQPREPGLKRLETNLQNARLCYEKQRTLALESLLYGELFEPRESEMIFHYLAMLGRNYTTLPSVSSLADYRFSHPSLLIGGTRQEAGLCDYVALADEDVASSDAIWSCSGVISPLADQSLATVVVSDVWKWLGLKVDRNGKTLLGYLASEIKRTAQEAFFIDSSSILASPGSSHLSVIELANTCHKYDLSFQIIPGV